MESRLCIRLSDLKEALKKEESRKTATKRAYGEYETVNYFERVKAEKEPFTQSPWSFRSNIYFDTETFELYGNKEDPDELPMIVPYAIGLCTDKPGSYVDFIGVDSAEKFFTHLTHMPEANRANLCAFNIDYDFHAIRPFIYEKNKSWCEFFYQMTEEKKFIYGAVLSKDLRKINRKGSPKKSRVNIRMVDLWKWDMTQSLRSYISNILKLTYDGDNRVKNDEIAQKLHESITSWGFTPDSFKKLEIDYRKVNLHQEGDKWFYWTSKEDWINDVNKKELDLSPQGLERTYLRVDVTSLPTISLEQSLMRSLALETLNITHPKDLDRTITAPGFAKYICEEYEQKYMTETYRVSTTPEVYKQMLNSYTGAFVGGNRDITYLDEEVFKRMFPGVSFYDETGATRIKSFDVNSMYPWAMSLGLPYGIVWPFKPKGESVEWLEVQFTDYIDPINKILYRWKPQYSCLNNTFFGDNFHFSLVPGHDFDNKVFVLRELYELFVSMCEVKCKVVSVRYQSVSKALIPFVNLLYSIKKNEPKSDGSKPYTDSTVALIKLILNSLYGKMAEKFRLHKHVWASDLKILLHENRYLLDVFDKLGVEVIDEEVIKRQKFKSNIAPYFNPEDTSGFYKVETQEKRFSRFGDECRESITAGIFITSKSRWKLLSTVKGEIDQGNVVLYCDTDSIKLITLKPPKFECHDSNLGAWKNEGDFHFFGHPNVLKKYFMFNPNRPVGHKKRWMVKSSGFDDSKLKLPGASDFDLETIRTVYDPNNRVIIRQAKANNKRNPWYQVVIGRSDYRFYFETSKDKPTHIVEDGKIKRV